MTLAILRIKKTKGVEYYLARFAFNGKRYEKSLDRVSSMTKDEAIKLLRTVKPSPSSSFIEKVKRWKNAKSYQQWHQSLNDYAMPTLVTIRVDKISTNDILNCLEPVWYDKPETANRVRAGIGAVMGWCKVRGYCLGENPACWRSNLDTVLSS